eukprot:TRINITY_DN58573_c0_g1_i1.p1 TRINITY_DN58573_c0_g1~~TRINITY_DN58573_c0_g1_i1.p1  ORF type:complete len:205 (+),score=15.58 TRINITY_DN58573_c0_g1_i1:385-999(+)
MNGKLIPLPGYVKIANGLLAGTAGALVGNPAEVALVRMQADSMLPLAERRNYRNVFSALYRVAKDESVATLWRGAGPTVLRAAAINGSSLAFYDTTKDFVDAAFGTTNGVLAVCCAATSAGCVAAATSMPFDYVKTQIQQMTPNVDGTMPYSSASDCALQTLRRRGVLAFYVGFPMYCFRICPAVAGIFFVLEAIVSVQKKLGI